MSPVVKISEPGTGVVRFTIDNPPINLFDPDVYAEFRLLVQRMSTDPELKVVIVDSADPDYFIAHLDVARLHEVPDRPGAADLATTWAETITTFASAPVLTIASVRGRCRGIGNELALACDLRFASLDKAVFAQPEIGFAVVPGGGGLNWLPRLVGRSRALEVLLSGDDFNAATAQSFGWVNRAIPDSLLDHHVDALARRVASFDKTAIATIKQIVDERVSPPSQGELLQSFAAISAAIDRPAAQQRMRTMVAAGWGGATEAERDHPALVGELSARLGME
ncbi:enoyl-CoA hydratase/isomerase family protein [Rudaeicoccus suwonensis]|uniref:Enoyl-CoA hydratase/carnithine racemase n=1 Tax=Rudaeicoccus suwonensis TaxID=657409 RepID=A0A561E861_9MICO|nr:enoyl-CoA hydratase/isomerase family protein [Rudaeicoccus suwonensis]TWE11804.1 enoyl-CoA hydratase/carnithine racemase [Rudaeicoccus suwonensis]